MSPTRYFDSLGLFDYGGGGFHCVWFDEGDMQVFKDRGLWAVSCPASNAKLASGVAPAVRVSGPGHKPRPRHGRGFLQQRPGYVPRDVPRLRAAKAPRARTPRPARPGTCSTPPAAPARARWACPTATASPPARRPTSRSSTSSAQACGPCMAPAQESGLQRLEGLCAPDHGRRAHTLRERRVPRGRQRGAHHRRSREIH